MNILFILLKFPIYGGVEQVSITLANALQEKGYNIHFLSQEGEKKELLKKLHPRIRYFYVNNYSTNSHNLETIINYINNNNIKCIFNQGCHPSVDQFLYHLHKKKEIPIISILHTDPLISIKDIQRNFIGYSWKACLKKLFKPIYIKYIKSTIKNNYQKVSYFSHTIILLSEYYKESFQLYSKSSNQQILVIPNLFTFPKNSDQFLKKKKEVLYVGRITEQAKRFSRIINIWSNIWQKFPEWKLIIIGDGEDKSNILESIKKRTIQNIEFKGFQKDVTPFMQQADILMLTSDSEGFPMVLIEAMHEQCIPIVYGTFPTSKEIITNKINGIIIPPFNQGLYEKELCNLMQDSQLRDKMKYNAVKKSMLYSTNKILPYWIQLINNIITK